MAHPQLTPLWPFLPPGAGRHVADVCRARSSPIRSDSGTLATLCVDISMVAHGFSSCQCLSFGITGHTLAVALLIFLFSYKHNYTPIVASIALIMSSIHCNSSIIALCSTYLGEFTREDSYGGGKEYCNRYSTGAIFLVELATRHQTRMGSDSWRATNHAGAYLTGPGTIHTDRGHTR